MGEKMRRGRDGRQRTTRCSQQRPSAATPGWAAMTRPLARGRRPRGLARRAPRRGLPDDSLATSIGPAHPPRRGCAGRSTLTNAQGRGAKVSALRDEPPNNSCKPCPPNAAVQLRARVGRAARCRRCSGGGRDTTRCSPRARRLQPLVRRQAPRASGGVASPRASGPGAPRGARPGAGRDLDRLGVRARARVPAAHRAPQRGGSRRAPLERQAEPPPVRPFAPPPNA